MSNTIQRSAYIPYSPKANPSTSRATPPPAHRRLLPFFFSSSSFLSCTAPTFSFARLIEHPNEDWIQWVVPASTSRLLPLRPVLSSGVACSSRPSFIPSYFVCDTCYHRDKAASIAMAEMMAIGFAGKSWAGPPVGLVRYTLHQFNRQIKREADALGKKRWKAAIPTWELYGSREREI